MSATFQICVAFPFWVTVAWHWPDYVLQCNNPWQQRLPGREPMLLCVSGTEVTLPHVCNGSVTWSYGQLNFLLMPIPAMEAASGHHWITALMKFPESVDTINKIEMLQLQKPIVQGELDNVGWWLVWIHDPCESAWLLPYIYSYWHQMDSQTITWCVGLTVNKPQQTSPCYTTNLGRSPSKVSITMSCNSH